MQQTGSAEFAATEDEGGFHNPVVASQASRESGFMARDRTVSRYFANIRDLSSEDTPDKEASKDGSITSLFTRLHLLAMQEGFSFFLPKSDSSSGDEGSRYFHHDELRRCMLRAKSDGALLKPPQTTPRGDKGVANHGELSVLSRRSYGSSRRYSLESWSKLDLSSLVGSSALQSFRRGGLGSKRSASEWRLRTGRMRKGASTTRSQQEKLPGGITTKSSTVSITSANESLRDIEDNRTEAGTPSSNRASRHAPLRDIRQENTMTFRICLQEQQKAEAPVIGIDGAKKRKVEDQPLSSSRQNAGVTVSFSQHKSSDDIHPQSHHRKEGVHEQSKYPEPHVSKSEICSSPHAIADRPVADDVSSRKSKNYDDQSRKDGNHDIVPKSDSIRHETKPPLTEKLNANSGMREHHSSESVHGPPAIKAANTEEFCQTEQFHTANDPQIPEAPFEAAPRGDLQTTAAGIHPFNTNGTVKHSWNMESEAWDCFDGELFPRQKPKTEAYQATHEEPPHHNLSPPIYVDQGGMQQRGDCPPYLSDKGTASPARSCPPEGVATDWRWASHDGGQGDLRAFYARDDGRTYHETRKAGPHSPDLWDSSAALTPVDVDWRSFEDDFMLYPTHPSATFPSEEVSIPDAWVSKQSSTTVSTSSNDIHLKKPAYHPHLHASPHAAHHRKGPTTQTRIHQDSNTCYPAVVEEVSAEWEKTRYADSYVVEEAGWGMPLPRWTDGLSKPGDWRHSGATRSGRRQQYWQHQGTPSGDQCYHWCAYCGEATFPFYQGAYVPSHCYIAPRLSPGIVPPLYGFSTSNEPKSFFLDEEPDFKKSVDADVEVSSGHLRRDSATKGLQESVAFYGPVRYETPVGTVPSSCGTVQYLPHAMEIFIHNYPPVHRGPVFHETFAAKNRHMPRRRVSKRKRNVRGNRRTNGSLLFMPPADKDSEVIKERDIDTAEERPAMEEDCFNEEVQNVAGWNEEGRPECESPNHDVTSECDLSKVSLQMLHYRNVPIKCGT